MNVQFNIGDQYNQNYKIDLTPENMTGEIVISINTGWDVKDNAPHFVYNVGVYYSATTAWYDAESLQEAAKLLQKIEKLNVASKISNEQRLASFLLKLSKLFDQTIEYDGKLADWLPMQPIVCHSKLLSIS